ncbi:MAG: hypothetical protein Phog2KO_21430 [Phototrophicaceae bacterium]
MSQTIATVISPSPRDMWEQILKIDPDTLITQTPQWTDAMCEFGRYSDASRYYKMVDGNQIIMPLVRKNSAPPFLRMQSSLPNSWGMGGFLSTQPMTTEHFQAIFKDLKSQPAIQTTIRPNPLHSDKWATSIPEDAIVIPRCAHVIELSDDFDTYWMSLAGRVRNKIRKAEKNGVTVECDTTGRLIPVFYDLLKLSFERWGKQQNEPLFMAKWRGQQRDPIHKFEILARVLGDACRIWVASIDGEPVSTIIVLQGKNAHYTRGAMNIDLIGNSYANYLLQKCAIEDAIQLGSRYYHMGESGNSEALSSFKSQFGAMPHDYAEYRLEKLPITKFDKNLRTMVKRLIGFKD